MSGGNSIFTNAARTGDLYEEFKKKAAEHFVPIKIALREAIKIWIRFEMGDRDFSRYMALYEAYHEMKEKVRNILQAEDVEDAERRINEILKEY